MTALAWSPAFSLHFPKGDWVMRTVPSLSFTYKWKEGQLKHRKIHGAILTGLFLDIFRAGVSRGLWGAALCLSVWAWYWYEHAFWQNLWCCHLENQTQDTSHVNYCVVLLYNWVSVSSQKDYVIIYSLHLKLHTYFPDGKKSWKPLQKVFLSHALTHTCTNNHITFYFICHPWNLYFDHCWCFAMRLESSAAAN